MALGRFILVALTAWGACAAADRWDRLAALPAGLAVDVETSAATRAQRARLVRVEPGRLIVRTTATATELAIERATIRRISRRSRLRGALIGGLAGFAVGFPFGAAAGPYMADYGFPSAAKRAKFGLGFGMFSAGVGAGIGALTRSRQTLYRYRRCPKRTRSR